jgi:hypothetical protein
MPAAPALPLRFVPAQKKAERARGISRGSSAIFERRSAAFRPLLAKELAFQDEVIVLGTFSTAVPCKDGHYLLNS